MVREAQQTVELRDGERELREVEIDILDVPDELEEVVGDEFDLCKDLLPPGPEVPHVADVLDDLLVGKRPHRIRAVPILSESLDINGMLTEEVIRIAVGLFRIDRTQSRGRTGKSLQQSVSYPDVTPIVIGSDRSGRRTSRPSNITSMWTSPPPR